MQKKIIIIGAGLAGLSAACMAVKRGYRVVIFEASHEIGGDSRSITLEGFTYDRNPKLFPAPYLLDTLIPGKSNSVSSHFAQMIPAVQINFADRKKMLFLSENELSQRMEKESTVPLLHGESSYQKLESILMDAMNHFTGKSQPIWKTVFKRKAKYLHRPLLSSIGQISSDPYMQQTLVALAASMGMKIESLQMMDLFLPALISRSGLFYPHGGIQSVIDLLVSYLQQAGVKIFTDLKVSEILPVQHNTIGIRLGDEQQEWADYILNTTQLLSPHTLKEQGTQPALVYHFGITAPVISSLEYFNIVILNHAMKSWSVRQAISHHWKPNYLYIHQPTLQDPTLAPAGNCLLTVKIPLPTDALPYQDKEIIREMVLSTIEAQFHQNFRSEIRMETSLLLSRDEKTAQKMPTLSSTSQPEMPLSFTKHENRLTHLTQMYENRRAGIPQILFAAQRWLESLEK